MSLVTIYWPSHTTRGEANRIRERFGITAGTTINGETPADIAEAGMPLLKETEKRGFIQIRNYKPELQGLFNTKRNEQTDN